jgi:dsRNA-specific ribonuclease
MISNRRDTHSDDDFNTHGLTSKDSFIMRILNEKNKPLTKSIVDNILAKYGVVHKVKKFELYQRAMIHDSYLNISTLTDKTAKLLKDIPPIRDPSDALPLQDRSYETLEYLGDAVIHLILASYLYNRYSTDKDEGFMTKLRTKIESGGTLSRLSRKLGLHEYAIFARNIELAGGRVNNVNIMEDVFEAFMGALFLDASYEVCNTFFVNIIDRELDIAQLIKTDDNYKEMLMQYFHAQGLKGTPVYSTLETYDDEPRRQYKMCVKDPDGKIVGTGYGLSKKIGEQNAAKMALIQFDAIKTVIRDDDDDEDDYYGEITNDSSDKEFVEPEKKKVTKKSDKIIL